MTFKMTHAAAAIVCAALCTPLSAASADTVSVSAGGSILGGNQVNMPISAPVNVCGLAVGVLGSAFASCGGGVNVGTPVGDASAQLGF